LHFFEEVIPIALSRPFPTRGVLRRPQLRLVDLIVGAGVLALLYGVYRLGQAVNVPFTPSRAQASVSTDPARLPGYALRSLSRMFVALGLSVGFTLVYATAAARLRRAEKVLIPLLDILQSVPILGFLSITVTAFLALFPHSLLGLECASIFAIFTSQAWNLTFSLYHSLITQPRELDEAARVMRLTKWQRFWKLDVPGSMIGLVWNGMMSFGGGWFFLTASEAITVNKHSYALPGIGSYVATASKQSELGKVLLAIGVMIVMVLAVNFVFWRPLVAWSEKFRNEQTEAAEQPRSIMLDTLRRSQVPHLVGRPLRPVTGWLDRGMRVFGTADRPLVTSPARRRAGDTVFGVAVAGVALWGAWTALAYVQDTIGLGEFPHAFWLGAITFARVVVVVAVSTLIWVPVGVKIGLSPRLARYAQPIVQVLASFPANFLFPFAAAFFIATSISLNVGGIVLMALGAQWYILFNTIAGAMAIPSDLREAMDNFGVRGWQRWRRLILPAIFPFYITGGITAAGGAWNASIVAEVVTYGSTTLFATGLGAYIAEATANGDFAKVLTGIIVMSIYVVGLNRLVWRRLFRLAETRYSL
jgi:NitT/TauT family transport system permease protein